MATMHDDQSASSVATLSDNRPTVLIGVTGCIAAYKACEVVRGLQKAGVRVKVVMTQNATRFVGSATFKALTREPVAVSLFDAPGDPIHHISLAEEADLFLIAPATANTIAKIATGRADDLLTTTALATEAPLLIAPAMNVHMWRDSATQENVETLRSRGCTFIGPDCGHLACGYDGEGKLATVEEIVETTLRELRRTRDLAGKRVLVTAGPTHEPLDPVRYLGNRSSGRAGYAIASEAARRGAEVTLISGPTELPDPFGVDVVRVQTAREMLDHSIPAFKKADIAIFAAAVADYRPAVVSADKMKKRAGEVRTIELELNPDILKLLAASKGDTYVVGFAAETGDPIAAAKGKLADKNADLIVANDVSDSALGFGTRDNRVWFVQDKGVEELEVMSKEAIAARIFDRAVADFA